MAKGDLFSKTPSWPTLLSAQDVALIERWLLFKQSLRQVPLYIILILFSRREWLCSCSGSGGGGGDDTSAGYSGGGRPNCIVICVSIILSMWQLPCLWWVLDLE